MSRTLPAVLLFAVTAALVAQTSPVPTLAMLADLNSTPSGTSSTPLAQAANRHGDTGDRHQFVRLGSLLVVAAEHEAYGQELWVTDGAAHSWPNGSTALLRDLRPGPVGSNPANLWVHGGYLWFTADDGTTGTQIYRSDGTTAGTVRINGVSPALSQGGGEFAPLDAQRFFYNGRPRTGGNPTLYLYDQGSEIAQTTQANYCNPMGCTPVPGGIVFRNHRTSQLHFADGTQVLNLSTGSGPVGPDKFVRLGNRVVFTARDNPNTTGLELWVTDGTAGGTLALADLRPGTLAGTDLDVACVHQGVLYCRGYDALAGSGTQQLWRTDGTPTGTWQVTSALTLSLAGISGMASDGTTLLIGTTGQGIFRSDGTLAGTSLLTASRAVSYLDHAAGRFWWQQAFAGTGSNYDALCWSDGTPAGTGVVSAPTAGSNGLRASYGMVEIAPGTVLLAGDDGVRGVELWRSDGSLAGTQLVADLHGRSWTASSWPQWFSELAPGRVVFRAYEPVHGHELWSSDGTPSGTALLADLEPGADSSNPMYCAALDGVVLFAAYTANHGRELWRTDGTVGGTSLVLDLEPGQTGSNPEYLTRVGNVVYFQAGDSQHGNELWVTDGTPAGTRLVVDVPGDSLRPTGFCELGDTGICYFRGTLAGDTELWRTDGTSLGTYRLLELWPAGSSFPEHLTKFGNLLLFEADDGVHGRELWRTDGTPAGTFLIEDLYPGAASSSPSDFVVDDFGHAAFLATHPSWGREIWQSDGTALGTSLAIDLVAGSGDMNPEALTWLGNRHLAFTASVSGFGREPWVSRDGLPHLTARLADVYPGSTSSMAAGNSAWFDSPRRFTDSLGRVYLTADDGVHGYELWTITQGAWSKAQGSSCSTGGWRPRLAVTPPVLGQMWRLEGRSVPANSFVAVGMSLPPLVPNQLSGGCRWHLNGLTFWPLPWFHTASTGWTQFVNLPNDPNLLGLRAALQSLHTLTGSAIDAYSNGVWVEAGN